MDQNKHTLKVIGGLLVNAPTHINKINSSDPNDPNRNKWKKEIDAALKRADRLAGRLKGTMRKAVKEIVKQIRSQVD